MSKQAQIQQAAAVAAELAAAGATAEEIAAAMAEALKTASKGGKREFKYPQAGTIAFTICRELRANEGDEDSDRVTQAILNTVYGEHDRAQTTEACVSWYRSKLRALGMLPQVKKLSDEEKATRKAAYDADWKRRQQAVKQTRREQVTALKAEQA